MSDDVSPQVALRRLIFGFRNSYIVAAAAELGVPDHLAGGAKSADELAPLVGADGPTLFRLLRALTVLGVVTPHADGRFGLTRVGELLRGDVAGSLWPAALYFSSEHIQRAWGGLTDSVRTGEAAFDRVHGTSFWQYRADHPEEARLFNLVMTGMTEQVTSAVTAAYDFSRFRRIVDVGGGRGQLLASILVANPAARGVLFDQPSVVDEARPYLEAAGVIDRCELVGGDFFVAVPSQADAYLLKWIIHDWNDEPSVRILESCRRAMDGGARLLLVERLVPTDLSAPDDAAFDVVMGDLMMLVFFAGRERTEAEYRALLAAAGFVLTRIVPTETPFSVIEAAPAV